MFDAHRRTMSTAWSPSSVVLNPGSNHPPISPSTKLSPTSSVNPLATAPTLHVCTVAGVMSSMGGFLP